jgi:PleD family two-component response regulator
MSDKQKILIVEDDPDLAEMLNAYFRVQGYDVLTSAWGEDAVRTSYQVMPDVVLLDIRLPDIDGYEVCRQLRSHRRTENLPIIFLTERRDRADRMLGLEMGAIDYITKPFDIQELRLRVRNALKRASRGTLVNAVTGLPEGTVVDDRLEQLLGSDGWALVTVTLRGLDQFREAYGFVASDDVLRAASLMTSDVVALGREAGSPSDFLGHLSAEDLVVVTTEGRAIDLRDRIRSRLSQSIEYFYPLRERQASTGADRLQLSIGVLTASSALPADVNGLKTAALRSRTT